MRRTALSAVLALVATSALVGSTRGPGPADARAATGSSLRPLPFFYDLYTFRGAGGATDVVASYAVPVRHLEREREEGEVRYRFNVTLVLADTLRGGVARSDDSVFVAVPRPLAGDHLLHTHIQTTARPSRTTEHRVLMHDATNPGIGQLYTDPFPIPDYRGSELMLSDIALGLPGAEAGWRRGDVTLALLPSSHFPSGVFDVYYEIYNLPPGRRYTTEMYFQPVDEAGEPVGEEDRIVRLRFTERAAADRGRTVRELKRLQAALERGRYRLTVTVTDERTQRRASQTRLLEVREWREGATMVPACPAAWGVDPSECPETRRITRPSTGR